MRRNKGFSTIEVVVTMSIFSVMVLAFSQLFLVSQQTARLGKEKIKAYALAHEYLEEVKGLRFNDWDLMVPGQYWVDTSSATINLVATTASETVGDYSRYLIIENIYRDDTGQIVDQASGTLDQSTRQLTATISWEQGTRQISLSSLVTRYYDNLSWQQTTVADFEAGVMDLVKVSDPILDDGEIELIGGCGSGSPESLIYDEQLENGWRHGCSGLSFWRWLFCKLISFFSNGSLQEQSTDYAYDDSTYSMRVQLDPPGSGTWWSWVRIFNFDSVCTVGFRNINFWVYNPSAVEVEFNVTAVDDQWDRKTVTAAPNDWTEVSLDYEQVGEGYEDTLGSIYFSKQMSAGDPALVVYIDKMELTGGVGGFFTEGTLVSSTLDTGKSSAFNRVGFLADLPDSTAVGLQIAISNAIDGPWVFYGPGGTGLTDDLYINQDGQGVWLGNNVGRYLKYKAFLKSFNGDNTPVLHQVFVNYSP